MKQTIRPKTFETNSSSYHSITIRKKKDNMPKDNIVKGKPTKLSGKVDIKTIGYTSSYQYISTNALDKANMLLRYMGSDIECRWIYDQEAYDKLCDTIRYNEPGYKEAYIEILKDYKPLQVMLKVISEYTGEETTVDFSHPASPYIDTVCDENKGLDDLLDLNGSEMEDEDMLHAALNWVIFNDDVEIIEECESNE